MKHKIIIDTDPGIDDTAAIFFALRSPEIDVLGITTVFGNGGVDLSTSNAIRIVEVAGRADISVARGATRPLIIPPRFGASYIHGEDGLGNAGERLPRPQGQPIDTRAANFIIETVLANPGEVTLVPIGPLTNIALAARLCPEIIEKVRAVVLMGGAAFSGGNASPVAEANIYNDPHAARIVVEAGWPVAMATWDVTLRFPFGSAEQARLAAIKNPISHFMSELLIHLAEQEAKAGYEVLLCDLLAVAYVVAPELFSVRRMPGYVETEGRSAGMTVFDVRPAHRAPSMHEIDVLLDVDAPRMANLFLERMARDM